MNCAANRDQFCAVSIMCMVIHSHIQPQLLCASVQEDVKRDQFCAVSIMRMVIHSHIQPQLLCASVQEDVKRDQIRAVAIMCMVIHSHIQPQLACASVRIYVYPPKEETISGRVKFKVYHGYVQCKIDSR